MNILFLIFNRPKETRQVFEEIRKARPEKLFISADGPRPTKIGEKEMCEQTREVAKLVDWPCELKTLFRDENLGCKKAVSSGISWFFDHVEEGIILEDDCLPDQSFFPFAETMLEKYRANENVMHITGGNFQFGNIRGGTDGGANGNTNGNADYFFSHSIHIWGWATWKRAWNKYDVEMSDLEQTVNSRKIQSLFSNKAVSDFWISLFKHIKNKKVDTWDTAWAYTVLKHGGLAINPNKNLIENIGFGDNATHMGDKDSYMLQKAETLDVTKLRHPSIIKADNEADIFEVKKLYIRPWYTKLLAKIKSFIGKRK